MKTYSIEKLGSDYVVKVDDQSVMIIGSRRRAAQLVVDASELLEEAPLAPASMPGDAGGAPEQGAVTAPSITRDGSEVA